MKRTVMAAGAGVLVGITLASAAMPGGGELRTDAGLDARALTSLPGENIDASESTTELGKAPFRGGESGTRSKHQVPSSDENANSPAPPEPTIARWHARLATHDSESIDAEWASQWTSSLANDFEDISSALGVAVVPPDCRSTTCAVELEWPSYEDAVATWDSVFRHNYSINCTRSIVLPEPNGITAEEGASVPYKTRMLFGSCRHWQPEGHESIGP